MPPSITETAFDTAEKIKDEKFSSTPLVGDRSEVKYKAPAVQASTSESFTNRVPLRLSGVLDRFQSFDATPVIGREFIDVNLAEWLRAPDSDDLIRDLAITISQRGVVFFCKQDDITNDLQKELVQRLGELSGKPSTSKLHIHPVSNSAREYGGKDDDSLPFQFEKKQSGKDGWHSDITFEPVPSDYALLRITQLPKTGGDTLWASGYELYDRLSTSYQRFLEGLTATYAQPLFLSAAQKNNFKLYDPPHGSPLNVGSSLTATHPVIRTNPVTGWKSIFALGHHVQNINEVTKEESKALLDWFLKLVVENHDLQVRHRWQNENDLAIWDNRSVYHAATPDYFDEGLR